MLDRAQLRQIFIAHSDKAKRSSCKKKIKTFCMSTTKECCVENNALLATDFICFFFLYPHATDSPPLRVNFPFFLFLLMENIVKLTLKHLFFCMSQSKRHWKGEFTSFNFDSDPDCLCELILLYFRSLSILFLYKFTCFWSNIRYFFHFKLALENLFFW